MIRQAIKFAIERKLPSVTLVHKGNIMKFTEGAFMKWGYALAEREFADKVFTWAHISKSQINRDRSCRQNAETG